MGPAKTGQSATWDSLGDELVNLILQKVSSRPAFTLADALRASKHTDCMEPSLVCLAQLSAVDKRMWRLCRDPNLYRHVQIHGQLPVGALQWLAARASGLESLTLLSLEAAPNCEQPALFEEIMFDWLREDVYFVPVQSDYLFAPDPAKYMAGIEAVLQASGPSLVRLELNHVSKVFSQWILYTIARHSHQLKSITLASNQFAGAHAGMCAIGAACSKVENFSVDEFERVKDNDSWLNDNTMAVLVRAWPNLKHISIERNGITLEGLCHLRHCQMLETFTFRFPNDNFSFRGFGTPGSQVLSNTVKVIEVDIPGCVISDDIRPLMLLCPNVKKINMVQDEMGDTSDVLDWEDDLRLLQREYPGVQFERHGVTFDYNRRREEVKKREIALAESRA